MGPDRPWALLLGALGVVALLAGCGVSREARASLGAGRQAVAKGAFREALEHLRTATRLAPDFAPAQLAQGEAAEVLGEFEEALEDTFELDIFSPIRQDWLDHTDTYFHR